MRHRVPWRNSRPSREFRNLGNVWPWPVTRRVLLRKCHILAEVGPRPREAQQTRGRQRFCSCRLSPLVPVPSNLGQRRLCGARVLELQAEEGEGRRRLQRKGVVQSAVGSPGQRQGSSLVTGTVPLVRDGDGVRTESVPVRPAQDPAGEEVAERPGRPRGTGSKGPGAGQARRQRHTCGRRPGTATLAVPGPFSARWCSPGFHAKLLRPNGSCSTLNGSWTDARCPRLCSEASGRRGPSA